MQIGDKVNLDDPKTGTFWNVTRELFNVDFRIKFTTNDQDDQTKWNLALASGDLPDFCEYIPMISYRADASGQPARGHYRRLERRR